MLVYLHIAYLLPTTSFNHNFISTTIRDNKLYTLYENSATEIYQVIVYEVNESLPSYTSTNGTAYSLIKIDRGFRLEFFDPLENIERNHNKLWLISRMYNISEADISSTYLNWVGSINCNDMKFSSVPSPIKNHSLNNFPITGHTINLITNEHGSALYIIGGLIRSNNDIGVAFTNSTFKYNFTTNEWIDLAPLSNGKLIRINSHKTVAINNRYLVSFSGNIYNSSSLDPSSQFTTNEYIVNNSLYSLWVFDTLTYIWKNIRIDDNIIDQKLFNLNFSEFSVNLYKNKIYALGGIVTDSESEKSNNYKTLGILDIELKKWSFSNLYNEDGNESTGGRGIQFHVFDLISQRMKYTLKMPNTQDTNQTIEKSQGMPAYALAIIVVGSTLLILYLIYYFCIKSIRDRLNSIINLEPKEPTMIEIWSTPGDQNIEQIIMGSNKKGIYIITDTLTKFKPQLRYSQSNTFYEFELIELYCDGISIERLPERDSIEQSSLIGHE
ncbi:hypothetical protein CONCODRAFT_12621 [Conidiobolus coronatus NRRL 28638]|uniref:Galactose oxidase n=1 Tax=Conidiobolus coronatus (strain ATCC 28846 / CBS 209.66 / NRRL 28638) TaxID=796925 RepID=A0A137NSI4_CONC2|nr:hypothetical protein CONCODRAFT_12621 [Conidiobolus coronatus NRRL 28638]|eukprot:KXN65717.1 hypothetical protein CONCODRAFT_12621 [Conidiobolus coronatus NRRL 28638]